MGIYRGVLYRDHSIIPHARTLDYKSCWCLGVVGLVRSIGISDESSVFTNHLLCSSLCTMVGSNSITSPKQALNLNSEGQAKNK